MSDLNEASRLKRRHMQTAHLALRARLNRRSLELLTPDGSSFTFPHSERPKSFVEETTMSRNHLPPLETSSPTSKVSSNPLSPTRRHQVQRSVSEFSAFPKLHRPHNHHHHHHHTGRHHKDDVAQSAGPNLQLNGEAVTSRSENATPNDSRDVSRRTSVLGSGWEDGERDRDNLVISEEQVAEEKQKGSQRAM
jgi:hypothetical protein